jgi:hypothetical protein
MSADPCVDEWQEAVAVKLIERLGKVEGLRVALWMESHPEKTLGIFVRVKDRGKVLEDGNVAVPLDDIVRELRLAVRGGVGDG